MHVLSDSLCQAHAILAAAVPRDAQGMVCSQQERCAMLQATHEQGLKWFGQAVQLVPDEAAGPADRMHLEEAAVAASQTPSKSCM